MQLVPIRRRPWPSISGHQWQAARTYVKERCELRVSFGSRRSAISSASSRTRRSSAVSSAIFLLNVPGDAQLGAQRLDESGLERLERPNLGATAVQTIGLSEGHLRAIRGHSKGNQGQSDG